VLRITTDVSAAAACSRCKHVTIGCGGKKHLGKRSFACCWCALCVFRMHHNLVRLQARPLLLVQGAADHHGRLCGSSMQQRQEFHMQEEVTTKHTACILFAGRCACLGCTTSHSAAAQLRELCPCMHAV
jgi:hypothetical protein